MFLDSFCSQSQYAAVIFTAIRADVHLFHTLSHHQTLLQRAVELETRSHVLLSLLEHSQHLQTTSRSCTAGPVHCYVRMSLYRRFKSSLSHFFSLLCCYNNSCFCWNKSVTSALYSFKHTAAVSEVDVGTLSSAVRALEPEALLKRFSWMISVRTR